MEVPGYTVDEGDPYRFIPEWLPCKFREMNKQMLSPCKKRLIPLNYCNKLELPIQQSTCQHCKERVE